MKRRTPPAQLRWLERQRQAGLVPFFVLLDQAVRRDLADRARRGRVTLSVMTEATLVEGLRTVRPGLLEAVRARRRREAIRGLPAPPLSS